MEFDFEIDDTILYQLNILDEILIDLGQSPVFENSDFIINKNSACTFGLDMGIVQSNKNVVLIDFFLEGNAMRIDIDRIPETFVWAYEDIEKSNSDVITFIKQLFTSFVLMEYFGSHTAMSLFNSKGIFIKHFNLRYYNPFKNLFNKNSKQRLFLPLYSK